MKAQITEENAQEYVQSWVAAGKSTKELITALKYRFNDCEKRGFTFKKLGKSSKNKRPHRALTAVDLDRLEELSKPHLKYHLGWRMLLDLACRVQDLITFRFNSFIADDADGGATQWVAKKTKTQREGYLT